MTAENPSLHCTHLLTEKCIFPVFCSEFCNVVSKIHIYTQEEVEKMTIGMMSDDTQSSLEQAPLIMETSKSSSVCQPDSSPTVVRI